jgi:hypothetical protein
VVTKAVPKSPIRAASNFGSISRVPSPLRMPRLPSTDATRCQFLLQESAAGRRQLLRH